VSGSARSPENKIPAVLKLETCAKRAIVRGAARVICASKGERDELRVEYPELEAERFTFITNGYDPADFGVAGLETKPSNQLTLMHAGTIYGGTAGEFFAALHQLVKEHPGIEGRMQVQLVGGIAHEYAETIRELESIGIVKTFSFQPHATALRMVMDSDVLVVLLGGEAFLTSEIPSKVFEYLCARKPILAIAGEGDVTEILRQSGLGIVVGPHSADNVAGALRDLVVDHAAGQLTRVPDLPYIRTFERAALTEKLANLLDAVKEAELARQ